MFAGNLMYKRYHIENPEWQLWRVGSLWIDSHETNPEHSPFSPPSVSVRLRTWPEPPRAPHINEIYLSCQCTAPRLNEIYLEGFLVSSYRAQGEEQVRTQKCGRITTHQKTDTTLWSLRLECQPAPTYTPEDPAGVYKLHYKEEE